MSVAIKVETSLGSSLSTKVKVENDLIKSILFAKITFPLVNCSLTFDLSTSVAPRAPNILKVRVLGAPGAPGALGAPEATNFDRSKVKEQLTKGKVIFANNILLWINFQISM